MYADVISLQEVKGGGSMGKARECPPFAQATCRKDGERVVEGWEKPGNARPLPRLCAGKMGKGWSEDGRSQEMPTLHPCYR